MTSQIFANIYLNEFDRYVRHSLKPLGYLRYGDDFVMFLDSQSKAKEKQAIGKVWLSKNLYLQVHPSNNWIFKARHGLYFLGHKIFPHSPLVVNKAMQTKIGRKINTSNTSSYKAMNLSKKQAKSLPWLLDRNENLGIE